MIIKQVRPDEEPVKRLIGKLDEFQVGLYGLPACNLESPDSLVNNQAFMVGAYLGEELAGIGAMKIVSDYGELKRMYVEEKFRGLEIAMEILKTLEAHARKQAVKTIFLETGNKQAAAMNFYRKHGYREVDRFGAYLPNEVSVYFGKPL